MTKETIAGLSTDQIEKAIRQRLSFEDISYQLSHVDKDLFREKEHRRFNMSGYGDSVLTTQAILNEFFDLGIYDYTTYLFLNFYKGDGVLYYQYIGEDENRTEDLGGHGTIEIIHKILQLTALSGRKPYRRD